MSSVFSEPQLKKTKYDTSEQVNIPSYLIPPPLIIPQIKSTSYSSSPSSVLLQTSPNPDNNSRIYIGSVPSPLTAKELMELFSVCGKVKKWEGGCGCSINHKSNSYYKAKKGKNCDCFGKSHIKNFSFITFSNENEKIFALNIMNNFEIMNKKLRVSLPSPSNIIHDKIETCLLIRNLPHQDTLETEKLKSLLNSISPSYKSFFRKESIVFIEFDDKISSLKCFKELSLQLPLFLIKEKILNENDEKLSIKLCRIDQKQKEFDLNT